MPQQEPERESFGQWVRDRRKALDLTQAALARQVQCSVSSIEKIEANERRPSRSVAEQLADALHIRRSERTHFVHWARQRPGEIAVPLPPPTNLAEADLPSIGRDQELAMLRTLVQQPAVRLITLTGTGGVGKTHLARSLMATLTLGYADGVWFVDLAALSHPQQVEPQIAQVLGITEQGYRALHPQLLEFLAPRSLLLVLDNFEHVRAAAGLLSAYLQAAPRLHILVTSRMALQVPDEHEVAIAPLVIPPHRRSPSLAVLAQYPAMALLLLQTRQHQPDFDLTPATAPSLVEICQQLDGLPLGLELAAARLRLFPPADLIDRLRHSTRMLSQPHTTPADRHHTLAQTVEWSYKLLPPRAQDLFIDLGVFRGGATIAAIEAICRRATDGPGVLLDALTLLLDAHLLQHDRASSDAPRLRMLETIRQYAAEQLRDRADYQDVWARYTRYYGTWMEQANEGITGPDQVAWLDRIDREQPNLHSILAWGLTDELRDDSVSIAKHLWRFWNIRSRFSEGRQWYEHILARADELSPADRAMLGLRIASMIWMQGEHATARQHWQETLHVARKHGLLRHASAALNGLGLIDLSMGAYADAVAAFEEALATSGRLNDPVVVANMALAKGYQGDLVAAIALAETALKGHRESGNQVEVARVLNNLTWMYLRRRDCRQAALRCAESRDLFEQLGDRVGLAWAYGNYGGLLLYEGRYADAHSAFQTTSAICQEVGINDGIDTCFEGWAALMLVHGDPEAAAQFLGSVDTFRQRHAIIRHPPDVRDFAQLEQAIRRALDPASFAAAYADGETMDSALMVARAVHWVPAHAWRTEPFHDILEDGRAQTAAAPTRES